MRQHCSIEDESYTLNRLGSYLQHDILAWDDDVDLRIALRDRKRFRKLMTKELSGQVSLVSTENEFGEYDKIFFPWSPAAGKELWSYPYIDIFYYEENATHMWRTDYISRFDEYCMISKQDIFPLVWRPLGEIWIPVSALNFS